MDVRIKRVYDAPAPDDGTRVLVDRLWPRGVSKSRAALDLWAKDAAPSDALRRRWHADPGAHEPDTFAAFATEYRGELRVAPGCDAFASLVELAHVNPRLTLLYAARDETSNHAIVLKDAIVAGSA